MISKCSQGALVASGSFSPKVASELDFFSALGGIRTPNLLIRSQML
jgi:hypothetical protein